MPAKRHSPSFVFDGCPARPSVSALRYASCRFLARSNLVFSQTGQQLLGDSIFCRFDTHCCTSRKTHQPEWFLFAKATLERRGMTSCYALHLISQAVEHVDQLPQAAVVPAVEGEGDSREVQKLVVLTLF